MNSSITISSGDGGEGGGGNMEEVSSQQDSIPKHNEANTASDIPEQDGANLAATVPKQDSTIHVPKQDSNLKVDGSNTDSNVLKQDEGTAGSNAAKDEPVPTSLPDQSGTVPLYIRTCTY